MDGGVDLVFSRFEVPMHQRIPHAGHEVSGKVGVPILLIIPDPRGRLSDANDVEHDGIEANRVPPERLDVTIAERLDGSRGESDHVSIPLLSRSGRHRAHPTTPRMPSGP